MKKNRKLTQEEIEKQARELMLIGMPQFRDHLAEKSYDLAVLQYAHQMAKDRFYTVKAKLLAAAIRRLS